MADKPNPSLATGAKLTPETWADFVARLKHHCRGEGVNEHHTAYAIFVVEARRFVYGIDKDSDPEIVICCSEGAVWQNTQAYWDDLDDGPRVELDRKAGLVDAGKSFLQLDVYAQHELLDKIDGISVLGRHEYWERINVHFTPEAADAFIKRKAHDYRDGLRVYVEAQPYNWEFETIKNAIMDGRLVLKDGA